MIKIDWVIVRSSTPARAAEFEFAVSELRRQLPGDARWLFGADVEQVLNEERADSEALVLILEHPWLSLERRCIDRLGRALLQGYDTVEACDSRYPAPMAPGGYATQRGMERYVSAYDFHVEAATGESGKPDALVKLTTLGALRRRSLHAEKAGRVVGAFAHDVSSYFGSDRAEVLALVPIHAQSFLDVGGGEGNFLKLIKSTREAQTHLVELDPDVASGALTNGKADHVWNGDFLGYQSTLKFDCISFLDMLEHVEHPDRYLSHARTLLSASGVVLASIPNVGHWSVVADLIEGRWDYVPAGIHCVTHLRFFTEQTIRDLFDTAGLVIERMERVLVPGPTEWLDQWRHTGELKIDLASLNTYAYLIVGRTKADS